MLNKYMDSTVVLRHFIAGERGRKAFESQHSCAPPTDERYPAQWVEGWQRAALMYAECSGYARLVDRGRARRVADV